MATTGELRAIMQELQLEDAGEAASYLGDEATATETVPSDMPLSFEEMFLLSTNSNALDADDSAIRHPVSA